MDTFLRESQSSNASTDSIILSNAFIFLRMRYLRNLGHIYLRTGFYVIYAYVNKKTPRIMYKITVRIPAFADIIYDFFLGHSPSVCAGSFLLYSCCGYVGNFLGR